MSRPITRPTSAVLPNRGTSAVALLAGAAGVGGSYAVAGFTPAFVAGPIAGFLSRRLPGAIVTATILVLGDAGELLAVATALALSTFLLAGVALLGILAARAIGAPLFGPPLVAAASALAAFVVTLAPASALAAGAATGGAVAVSELAALPDLESVSGDRRRLLGGVATAAGIATGGYLFGTGGGRRGATGAAEPLEASPSVLAEIDSLLETAEEQSLDVDGVEPLVSESFYEVDINATDPVVAADDWTLSVTGAVEEPVSYDYDEIRSMAAANRFVSLRCVGETLNGEKMDTALWTGVPIRKLVDPAGPAEECCVMLRAADGYYEEFPLTALTDGFLAFGMNGETLPQGHGYPARALIPGHWGEINVKWLTEIEVLEQPVDGYWEERGWHGTGPVETVAKLHLVDRLEDGRIRVGGHAYAGTRGVRAVEVSVDGGETWTGADLSEPLPGEDVWRQWTHAYDPPAGAHEVVVRATDGEGTLQSREETGRYPSGPTGWVSRTVEP